MSVNVSEFPIVVWAGITPNHPSREDDKDPNFNDYDQLVAELIAVQTFALTISGPQAGLLADGSVPLTASWDVGAFTITASQFESNIITGDAPFIVASTTVVVNLNADTVDDIEAAALSRVDGSIDKTGKQKFTSVYQDWNDATDDTTITFDLDLSNKHRVTLTDNRTLALSNPDGAQAFTIKLIQDAGGTNTVTWFDTIKWAGGSAPTLTTTGLKADTFMFIRTGTDTYDGFIVGQDI